MRRHPWVLVVAAALIATACTGDDDPTGEPTVTSTPAPPSTTAVSGTTETSVGDSSGASTTEPAPTTTTEPAPTTTAEPAWTYAATVRRTEHNVPHISASEYSGLGFGYGYAMAEDHYCTLADLAVQVRGEAAANFGAGQNDRWLNQDLVYQALDLHGSAATELEGLEPDIADLTIGFAAGVNRYLADTGADSIVGYCAGADWIGEITPVDVAAFAKRLSWLASIDPMMDFIATAQPPASGDESADLPDPSGLRNPMPAPTETGSNAWAIGPERTADGTTMLLGNPHFPWQGALRFYEAHLTIPGELDVYGMSLIGSPVINIGFNADVAWSHTVSAGRRFTAYTLELDPADATAYLYDGESRPMTPVTVTVDVRGPDGSTTTVERTLYSTHYGPVVNLPGVGWSPSMTMAIRDANADNDEIGSQFLAMARSESMDDLIDAHRTWQGIPWVNTVAASSDGRIWYADTASTPNLSPAAIDAWSERLTTDAFTGIAFENGIYLLDGSDPLFEWVDDPTARDPGVEPFELKPQLERSDYVFNANDPYWVANGDEFLDGASPLHGLADTALSTRTRMNVRQLATDTGGAGDDGLFTLAELQATALSNRVFTAEALMDEFVVRCRAESPEQALCDVLAAWDRRVDIDSVGAALWREFIDSFSFAELTDAGPLWANGFDPADPINTPNGLSDDPELIDRLVAAAENLRSAGFEIDTPLGEIQIAHRGDIKVPIHGGNGAEGVTNIIGPGSNDSTSEPEIPSGAPIEGSGTLTADGYPVAAGTSFIYTVEFTADGPVAAGFLTYGETGDPASPFYSDQTERFAAKDWRPFRFTEADITASPDLREYQLTE